MSAIAFTLPVPDTGATVVREFVGELLGPRRTEFEESWRQKGVKREMSWLQQTSQGSIMIVYLEADDPARFYAELATSTSPFDVWYREQVHRVYGLDLSQPWAEPPSELIASWPGDERE